MKALGRYVGLIGGIRNHLAERVVRSIPVPMRKTIYVLPRHADFYDVLDNTLWFKGY